MGKLVALALALLLAACGGGDGREAAGVRPPAAAGFRTRTPGVLTVATELAQPAVRARRGRGPPAGRGSRSTWSTASPSDWGGAGPVGQLPVHQAGRRGPLPVRLRRQRGVDPARPPPAGRLLLPLLHRQPGRWSAASNYNVTGLADARRLKFGVQEATSGAALPGTCPSSRWSRPGVRHDHGRVRRLPRAGRVDAVMSDVPIVVDAAGRHPGWPWSASSRPTSSTGRSSLAILQHQAPVAGDRPAPRRRRARPAVPEVLPRAGEHPAARLTAGRPVQERPC